MRHGIDAVAKPHLATTVRFSARIAAVTKPRIASAVPATHVAAFSPANVAPSHLTLAKVAPIRPAITDRTAPVIANTTVVRQPAAMPVVRNVDAVRNDGANPDYAAPATQRVAPVGDRAVAPQDIARVR